jgi:hypothetical protein
MNRFLRAADREAWAKTRSRGFARFFLDETWPLGVGAAAGYVVWGSIREGRHFHWTEAVFWLGWGLFWGAFGSVIKWWNRERAYRKEASADSATAA